MARLSNSIPMLVVMALAACGGKSFEVEPDPQGGSGGSGNEAGTEQGGSGAKAGTSHGGSVGKAGTGGTGEGGTAGGPCDGFNDEPGAFVSVAIINKTSGPIYLGQDTVTCDVSPLFAVRNAQGEPLSGPGFCSSSCQQLRDNGPVGCPAICAYPSAIKLAPGEIYYTSWDGLYQLQRELPLECSAPGSARDALTCMQTLQARPGMFTFTSLAGSSPDCAQTMGGACGECQATGNGGCTIAGSLISGARHDAKTSVYLDASYGLFGAAAAPAPADPAIGGSSSGAIALLTVELVFAD